MYVFPVLIVSTLPACRACCVPPFFVCCDVMPLCLPTRWWLVVVLVSAPWTSDGLATEVVPSFYVTVKYLREVTPYFRKASIISEVGWELQKAFLSQRPPSPRQNAPRADTRYIPLQLCYLTRNFRHQDPGKQINFLLLLYLIVHTLVFS